MKPAQRQTRRQQRTSPQSLVSIRVMATGIKQLLQRRRLRKQKPLALFLRRDSAPIHGPATTTDLVTGHAMTQPVTATRNPPQPSLIRPSSIPPQLRLSQRFRLAVRKAAGLGSVTGALSAAAQFVIRVRHKLRRTVTSET